MKSSLAIILLASLLFACTNSESIPASNVAVTAEVKKERADLHATMSKIVPFFKPMGKPAGYDWLASHNEPGQTFDEFLDANPAKPTKERQKIYVLPLGTFNVKEQKVIAVTAGYLEAFYDLPVSVMPSKPMPKPTKGADHRTVHQLIANSGRFPPFEQIRTGYINDDILLPIKPKDAAALIALTNEDLFPDASMNYVFGQASLENRVGVWSMVRLGEKGDYNTFLSRTLKIATHETGHMFGMRHCTKYECIMSGTNNLAETDSRPIDACPECMAKICWLSDISPTDRYTRLATFCRKNGLNKEADDFTRKAAACKNRER